jgi:hypothetical protein
MTKGSCGLLDEASSVILKEKHRFASMISTVHWQSSASIATFVTVRKMGTSGASLESEITGPLVSNWTKFQTRHSIPEDRVVVNIPASQFITAVRHRKRANHGSTALQNSF